MTLGLKSFVSLYPPVVTLINCAFEQRVGYNQWDTI